jgi:predicted TIM-barrel fold metal-dependent hydrolase
LTGAAIPLVDAHHHLWDLGKLQYRWLEQEDPAETALIGDYGPIRRTYLISDYLADIATSAVSGSVHVQAAYSGPDPVAETAWLQSVADEHGFPDAIVAYCDLAARDADLQLDRHLVHANMRGVRTFTDGDALLEGNFQRGLAALGERGLVYDMQISLESMGFARSLADMHQDVQFVLEHAGLPAARDNEYYQAWRAALGCLADATNVAAKVSGLGMTDHAWSAASVRRWALTVAETFGTTRTMFGSNWPVDSLHSDYHAVATAYRQLASEFSPADQHLLLHANAERIYRLATR